jgi:hypothetical protein
MERVGDSLFLFWLEWQNDTSATGPAGYSSKTGRKIKKYRASSLFFHLGWTGRIRIEL